MRCTTDYSMNARRTTKSFKARIGLAVGVGNQIQTGDEMTTELETRLREIEEREKAVDPKRKRRRRTWGEVYRNALTRGDDHGYAAFLADEYVRRQNRQKQTKEAGE